MIKMVDLNGPHQIKDPYHKRTVNIYNHYLPEFSLQLSPATVSLPGT